ncbi:hypothetical protein RJ639_015268 [Escallonia herrerae]|uniref:Uncharacterized protein n=1 Tax=Escallonia herrerae TaxID=1293975 RepID=A0AA89AQQ5_9ASTE|nr:hypothetical protein RJ639_015268 [Escallonia herrerae]
MVEEGKGKVEKFNGMNFQWWKMQVEDYLYQKDLYLSLVREKPEAMNASEWVILDRKALATTEHFRSLANEGYWLYDLARHYCRALWACCFLNRKMQLSRLAY